MILGVLAQAAPAAEPRPVFRDSPHREAIPDPGPCDVVIDATTPLATLDPLLNDPSKRVFCVEPGDYRGAGMLLVWVSGTPTNRRFLRFQGPGEELRAFQRSAQAIFESIHVFGSWWVVQGLTFLPRESTTDRVLAVRGGDHNVLDGNLIDAAEQLKHGQQWRAGAGLQGRSRHLQHGAGQRGAQRQCQPPRRRLRGRS